MSPSLPNPTRLRRALDMARALPGRRLALQRARAAGHPTRTSEHWLTTAAGYRVAVHLHEPDDDQPRPALVLVPGRNKSGSVFCGESYLLGAEETAVRGIRTVHFDPVGRGRSWGHDAFCGSEGQDSFRAVLEFVQSMRSVRPGSIGVATFSMGLALAAPVLVRNVDHLRVRFLLDWEGPADRVAILHGGALPPAARTALTREPDSFWALREPVAWVDRLPCRYIRIQSKNDHASGPGGVDGALSLIALSTRGLAESTRLNDNPADTAWRIDQANDMRWAPSDVTSLNRLIIDTVISGLEHA